MVEPLIEWNRDRFKDHDVSFQAADITSAKLPSSDVVIIKQVLQHLSNQQISKVVDQIRDKYQFLVVAENVSVSSNFIPNIDIPSGDGVRIGFNSGVVLTEAPFHLQPKEELLLCSVPEYGLVNTTLYRL